VELETERLLLRPFRPSDLPALFAIQSRPDVARHLYWEARSEEQVRGALEQKMAMLDLHEDGDALSFAVILRDSGELVGDCMLSLTSREHRQGEIGFVFHPHHHGRGYATEASRALLAVAFKRYRMHRVVGRLEARNTASARVLERLGMRREAHLIENEFVKGEWQSEIVYAMLAREWQPSTHPTGGTT
jgi:RimJ/RimL family protein N-acetyltransferase